jgi:hypothetical protein
MAWSDEAREAAAAARGKGAAHQDGVHKALAMQPVEHADLHPQFQISGRGTFSDYKEAATEGRKYARYLGKDVGMERANEFGKTVYNVTPLPKPENRYGHELRMEVLSPHDPL